MRISTEPFFFQGLENYKAMKATGFFFDEMLNDTVPEVTPLATNQELKTQDNLSVRRASAETRGGTLQRNPVFLGNGANEEIIFI